MSTARRRPRIDLSFGPGHGPVSGVLNAAVSMWVLTSFLWLALVNPVWGLTTGILVGAAGVAVARKYGQPLKVEVYRGACWISAALWSFWVLLRFHGIPVDQITLITWHPFDPGTRWLTSISSPTSPWTWPAAITLGTGAALLSALGWHITRAEREAERLAELTAQREKEAAEIEAWNAYQAIIPVHEQEGIAFKVQPVLRRITGCDTLTIDAVQKWEPFYGFTAAIELPADGTSLGDIKKWEEALAYAMPSLDGSGHDAGLPEGCGVEIVGHAGKGRRRILMHVTTGLALAEDIPHPMRPEYETIENLQAIGVNSNGTTAEIDQRYNCVTLVGQTDSGKSNQLNTIIGSNAQCTDVLLVGIDISGHGRVFRPWLRAYVERRAKKPIFCQVAPNENRARLLATSLLQIVNGRTAVYADLMYAEKNDKIMVRPALPEIILYVDEFGTLPRDVREIIGTIVDTGRGAGVRVVSCALEASESYIPRSIITQSRIRLAMRVSDEAQLQFLFDAMWSRGRFDPATLVWKGSGMYADGPSIPARFKGYRTDPTMVDAMSELYADRRPALDQASLELGDTVTVEEYNAKGYREEVTYTGVWTNAEADTYPEIFPAGKGAGMGETTEHGNGSGTTATLTREEDNMTDTDSIGGAGERMGSAVANMFGSLADLEREVADGDAAEAATDKGGDDAGDQDDEAEILRRLAEMPPVEPDRPWNKPPAGHTPPADKPDRPSPSNRNPGGFIHPKKRVLQLVVAYAEKGGVGASQLERLLRAEGYNTDRATINLWLKAWLEAHVVDQAGDRQPYFPGPDIGDVA